MASSALWRRSPPVYVLTVAWAPYPIRVATRRVSVTDREGRVRQYSAGLEEPEIEERVGLDGQGGGPRDVTVRCLLPVDVSARMSRGGHWWNVEGELALWCELEPWEERLVLLRGRVTPVSWGPRGNPLELQLSEPAWEDPAVWPPTDATVTRKTWPDAPESSLGARYPWVFGMLAGALRDEDGTAYSVPATPAVVVHEGDSLLLVAGHPVVATSVIIRNETQDDSSTLAVTTQRDGLGRYVSVVDFSSEGTWTAEDTYSVRDWDAGGHQAEDGPGPLRGLGDLILYWLRRSGLTVDLSAWRAYRDVWNRVEVAGYVDDPVAPLTFVRDVVLPLLPDLALAPGPRGIRPVWWRPLAGGHVREITVGATYARTETAPTLADAQPVTDVDVAFGRDLEEDEHRGKAGVVGDEWSSNATSSGPTTHSRAGRARHGRPELLSLESRWLWQARDAHDVARTRVRMGWTPPEQDVLSIPLWALPLHELGEVVSVTDEETTQVERRWWVAGRSIRGGRVELALERVEDPVSAPRRAS